MPLMVQFIGIASLMSLQVGDDSGHFVNASVDPIDSTLNFNSLSEAAIKMKLIV